MDRRAKTYSEFWPRYLAKHRAVGNRRLHVLGTGLAILFLASAAITMDWRFVPAAILVGYGLAWGGHAFVERNRPATFSHPFWSLCSDFRMFALWSTGRLGAELHRHGLD